MEEKKDLLKEIIEREVSQAYYKKLAELPAPPEGYYYNPVLKEVKVLKGDVSDCKIDITITIDIEPL